MEILIGRWAKISMQSSVVVVRYELKTVLILLQDGSDDCKNIFIRGDFGESSARLSNFLRSADVRCWACKCGRCSISTRRPNWVSWLWLHYTSRWAGKGMGGRGFDTGLSAGESCGVSNSTLRWRRRKNSLFMKNACALRRVYSILSLLFFVFKSAICSSHSMVSFTPHHYVSNRFGCALSPIVHMSQAQWASAPQPFLPDLRIALRLCAM